jgi:predicted secreted protein
MTWSLGTATYFIIWWTLLFAILPFGVQSQHELDDVVPGSDPGAPARPRLLLKIAANTVIAGIVWAIFDYVYILYLIPR